MLGGFFKMDTKKGDPSLMLSLASITTTLGYRLSAYLLALLNRNMYPLSGSSGPCQISFRLVSIFGHSLQVTETDLNFSLKSNHESMVLDLRDWNHFNAVDFSWNRIVWKIIEAEAPVYDYVDKWLFGSDDPSYNS